MLTIWFIGMYVIFILQQIMIWVLVKKLEKIFQLPIVEGSIRYDDNVRPYAKIKLSKRR